MKLFPGFSLPSYRSVWRWHFYAGLSCVPFVIVLALSGTLYLFQPQIEAWIDRPYDNLEIRSTSTSPASAVRAAEAAFPESTFRFYEVPPSETAAARVMLVQNHSRLRTYIHPANLQVLHSVPEEERFMRVVRRLHGQFGIGESGSYVVELVACWTVILVVTGLFLWWPRNAKGLGGVLYPRLRSGKKVFWRDIHSVTGIWVSVLVLVLIMTGLPWAKFWGGYFKNLRQVTHTSVVKQSWSTRSSFRDEPPAEGYDVTQLDRVVESIAGLRLPHPIQVSPPAGKSEYWTVESMTPNRPQRVTLAVDGASGEIVSRHDFSQDHVVDRVVGTGIAFHEGQLFGWPNQLLGVLTTSGLLMMSVSGVILWWRRRPPGKLGAPEPTSSKPSSMALVAFVVLLGIALPLFGLSLIVVLLVDWLLLANSPRAKAWLGLSAILAVAMLTGCGPDRLERGTQGTITVAGEPVIDVRVKVYSMQDGQPEEQGFAVSRTNGELHFVTAGAEDPLDLEPGEYHFTVESVGSQLMLPDDYADPALTPLVVTLPVDEGLTLTLPEPIPANQ